jgi:hypothetical protein
MASSLPLVLLLATLLAFPLPDSPVCKGLQLCYNLYSKLYFDGKLPPATVSYGPCPILNVQACTYKDDDGRFIVRLIPKYNSAPDTAHMNLLHETCHLAHWNEEFNDHGPVWQRCMHHLADVGAFEAIW